MAAAGEPGWPDRQSFTAGRPDCTGLQPPLAKPSP